MPKKGGKKKNKGGKGPAAAAAAADNVTDTAKTVVQPGHEVEDKVKYGEGKGEDVAETPAAATQATEGAAPELSTKTPTTAAPAVTETKEAQKEAEKATPKEEGTLQETVDKAQASKAGQIGQVDGGDGEAIAVLPEPTTKEPSIPAETYPSTSEIAAEESATSTAATAGAAAGTTTLAERPKTSELMAEAETPTEADAAHVKRPYEKPIFSSDETKPPKMAKHEEEEAHANTALDKKTLAGAGPASTAAYTTPEPVPVKKAEEKKDGKIKADGTASPDAVAAAAAAISSSKVPEKTTAAAPEAEPKLPEPKLPEPVLKKGEEPKVEAAKETKEEPKETEAAAAAEVAEKKKKKEKGGFFSRVKRMFK